MTAERELVERMQQHVEALQEAMREYRATTGRDITGVGPTSAIDRLWRQLNRGAERLRCIEEYDRNHHGGSGAEPN